MKKQTDESIQLGIPENGQYERNRDLSSDGIQEQLVEKTVLESNNSIHLDNNSSNSEEAKTSDEKTDSVATTEYDKIIHSIEETLLATRIDIQTINERFGNVVSNTILLEKAINASYYEAGIKKICYILEKIKRLKSEFTDAISEELTNILINDFHAEMIQPSAGDEYDSTKHERVNTTSQGNNIVSCSMVGWRIKDHTLIRAIVETK